MKKPPKRLVFVVDNEEYLYGAEKRWQPRACAKCLDRDYPGSAPHLVVEYALVDAKKGRKK